jgi:predicted DNA-binding transcriptional regulator AlpA
LETPCKDQAAANLAAVVAAKAAAARETNASRVQWIPAPHLADELGISRRTLARWLRDIALGFPRPRIVNHRLYFERSAVDAWKTATAVKAAIALPRHALPKLEEPAE